MSYDAYPNCANCISIDFIKEQIPLAMSMFFDTLEKGDITLDDFAQYKAEDRPIDDLNPDITEKQIDEINLYWDKIIEDFKNKTGLSLYIIYFLPEDGNRGDDYSGNNKGNSVYFHTLDDVHIAAR